MDESLVARVLNLYGLGYLWILPSEKGYRNKIYPIELQDRKIIQLTFFKNEPGILDRVQRADEVSEYVSSYGLPARVRFDKKTIQLSNQNRRVYAGLYTYLPGNTIAWEAYTKTHIKLLGQTMSDMHAILARQEFANQTNVIDESKSLLARIDKYLSSDDVKMALLKKLDITINVDFLKYHKLLDGCAELPGQQQLHMDFVRGNILFAPASSTDICQLDNLAITGILDFEKTAVGLPIFDVARTLAFLLVDCKNKTPDKVWKYFLHSGYRKRGATKLTYNNLLLRQLVEFFLLHDIYKFLRHNPYESLNENEHFIRTKYIMSEYGMIH
jgi:Ser/Thr protein kinase RdoA (MazF antagonist)